MIKVTSVTLKYLKKQIDEFTLGVLVLKRKVILS